MMTRQEIQAEVKDHLFYVLVPKGLPLNYVLRIAFTDGIITVIGLCIWFTPLFAGFYPGGFNTTLHVTFGAIVTALAFFRVSLAYLSAWMEVPIIVLGLLILRLPAFLHMEWNAKYTMAHVAAGGAIVVLALISGLMTLIQHKKMKA
jgi:heme/copper-type cytochrome/quinol oxidase subunit 4